MRILISSLLLLGGLNLVLARSIYWNDHKSMANVWLSNYNDELFQYLSNRYNDNIHKVIMVSEESAIEDDEEVKHANFFSSMFDTSQENDSTKKEKSEEDTNNNKAISNNENDNEGDNNDDEENNQFEISLHVPYDNMEIELEVSQSSEEKKDDEEENSDEVSKPASNVVVEFDLTKSSEEKEEDDEEDDLSITLTARDENPDYPDNEQDDELKSKEVDEFECFLYDEEKENEENNDDVATPTNDSDEEDNDYTTAKTDRNEDDDNDYTTPKNDSNEDDDTNTSNSNGNETEDISIVFHGIDDDHHESNLNDHKYEIVKTSPSDSPYMNVIRSFSSSRVDNQNVIQEYVEIRQELDMEQDTLQLNKLNLDRDFYNIISDDFNEDSINKFEKDFFVVHENLDRIKRNVNAMQNLNSKLYFYKLIKDAVKDVQHK